MKQHPATLLTWHSVGRGEVVLRSAVELLGEEGIEIRRVLYLVQRQFAEQVRVALRGIAVELIEVDLADPTDHAAIYDALRAQVLPKLHSAECLHVNVSPGTPAMHAVWLVLHAGGAFPIGTRLWSSQVGPGNADPRINPVRFEVRTYLAEVRRAQEKRPELAYYELEARSPQRREAFDVLCRYARLNHAPLLVLGERGTGKSRLVETLVGKARGKGIVSLACGGIDPALAESMLFGHVRGAFTGAVSDRPGAIASAKGKLLFLDEVQDLPRTVQRKLVRVLQDQRYTPVGSDKELRADFELVCASNRPLSALQELIDPDLFDRLAHLVVTIPPLRECRADLESDWRGVWRERCVDAARSGEAPWNKAIEQALASDALPGNFRDLQRLALLCMAWEYPSGGAVALDTAIGQWRASRAAPEAVCPPDFFEGTRDERTRCFQRALALWAKARFSTWTRAAAELGCDERTLRGDAR
ncbi:MAG: sigma 54-interacting transcriptional regulator [Phycisphaerales bacterium]